MEENGVELEPLRKESTENLRSLFPEIASRRDVEAVKFLTENFNRKECTVFVELEGRHRKKRCICGRDKEEHEDFDVDQPDFDQRDSPKRKPNILRRNPLDPASLPHDGRGKIAGKDRDKKEEESPEIPWSEDFIKALPTNAFGRINFVNARDSAFRKKAKYVRLADDSDMGQVIRLLHSFWRLTYPDNPELVTSIIGGGKRFNIKDKAKRESFSRSLIRTMETTRGWLITSGTHTGVAKMIGSAVKERQSLKWFEDEQTLTSTLRCIGIPPWGLVKNNEDLINEDPLTLHDATYSVDWRERDKGSVSLDPNHSHFLLVDDGQARRFEGTAKFRAALEKRISMRENEGGLGVPVVCLLIEGGVSTLEQTRESLNQGLPLIVCDGTGRAADLIATAVNNVSAHIKGEPPELDETTFTQFMAEPFKTHFPDYHNSKYMKQKMMDDIIQICNCRKQIQICPFDSYANLDLTILASLMEGKDLDLRDQLRLAFKWNRSDMAAVLLNNPDLYSKAFTSKRLNDLHSSKSIFALLQELFRSALLDGKTEFVQLFIDHGFSVEKYLNVAELRTLYQNTLPNQLHLYKLMGVRNKRKKLENIKISLFKVHLIIRSFTRRFNNPLYINDTDYSNENLHKFRCPHRELFLWSILTNRHAIALLFWDFVEDPVMTGTVGTLICRGVADSVDSINQELVAHCEEFKECLELRTVGVIERTYDMNRENSILLINRPQAVWGNMSPIGVAALAADYLVLSSRTAQYSINEIWKPGFEANGFKLAASTFLFFPIFFFVTFDEDMQEMEEITPTSPAMQPMMMVGRQAVNPYFYMINNTIAYPKLNRYNSVGNREPTFMSVRRRRSTFTDRGHQSSTTSSGVMGEKRCLNQIPFVRKIVQFYSAPVVKFTSHTFWYIIFLMVYSWVVLFDLRPELTVLESIVYGWQLTFILEEIRYVSNYPGENLFYRVRDWWSFGSFATWNQIDFVIYLLSCLAFGLRFSPSMYPLARLIFVVNLAGYIIRVLKVYFVNSYLGPKVIMIKRMSGDLLMFIMVLVIATASYSITAQGLSNAGHGFTPSSFWDLYHRGVWEIFGELNEDSVEGVVEGCSAANWTRWDWDCILRRRPIPILLMLYLFFVTVLLINMLIAIFTHVFDDVQANSEKIWKYQMYFLVEEYKDKPLLPPPFIILSHVYKVLKWIRKFIFLHWRKPTVVEGTIKILGRQLCPKEQENLLIMERVCRADFMEELRVSEASKIENAIVALQENVNKLSESLTQHISSHQTDIRTETPQADEE